MKILLHRNNNNNLNIITKLNKIILNNNYTNISKLNNNINKNINNNNKLYSFVTIRNNFNITKINIQSYFNRLFSVPKGFGKFFPEGKTPNSSPSSTSSPKTGTTGTGNKGKIPNENPTSKESATKGNQKNESFTDNIFKSKDKKKSGSGGNNNEDPFAYIGPGLFTMALIGGFLFLLDGRVAGREISWQEFEINYLNRGLVKKVSVSNRSIARVELKRQINFPWSTSVTKTPTSELKNSEYDTSHEEFVELQNTQQQQQQQQPTDNIETTSPTVSPSLGSPFGESVYFTIGSVESFERKMEAAQAKLRQQSMDPVEVIYRVENQYYKMFLEMLPTFIVVGMIIAMSRGAGGSGGPMGNIFKIGKSTATMVKKEDMKITFKDVAGCDEAKKEVMEFVEFLKSPEKFKSLGAKVPRGALLAGPPGTGKTLLAKATAGEANVPFFSISGSDFVEMFVGVGASRVRDLFKEARANAPCIIFIDEIDAVGRARGKGGVGGHDERENTLNQLLIEMDGFNTDASVIMLAGTNRADMLDSALTRPGRFDRTIAVELPDIKGRKSIFDVHLKNIKLKGPIEEYSPRLAALTPGFSGADIANICNEAAIHAGRKNKTAVELEDFESATDRVIGGLESTKIISPEEKRIVAFHEAGHAVAGWYLEHANPLLKVTIVPRSKGSLGYAQYLPKEISLRTKEQVMDLVCMALAGRASELVHFGKYTTGASDDLNKVTQIIYQLVQVYGMNDKVGQLAFPQREGQWPQERAYSESTAQLMDEEVRALADYAFKRTVELMEQYKDDVTRVAELLIKQETIDHSDIAKLIGERKFSAGKEYDEFVATKKVIEDEATNTTTTETTETSSSTEEKKSTNDSNSEGGVQVGLS